jgi:hypothetical protein
MNVKGILDSAIEISIGLENVFETKDGSRSERDRYLEYLNMACETLYLKTAPLDEYQCYYYTYTVEDEEQGIEIKDNDDVNVKVLQIHDVIDKNNNKFIIKPFQEFKKLKFLYSFFY